MTPLFARKAIAVLPFKGHTDSKESDPFSEGFSDEIIFALSKIQGLKVTSRTSSFRYRNSRLKAKKIGQELGVSILVEGSVQQRGNDIRVHIQLIDAEEDAAIWSNRWDRGIQDLFHLQDIVSIQIADQLREVLGHIEIKSHLVDTYPISLDTYQEYLKGRYYLMNLNYLEVRKGIDILEDVHLREPDFPHACLDLNQGYAYLGTMGMIPANEAFQKAAPYLEKAIKLAPHLPKTLLNKAWISCWQHWDLDAAYGYLQEAVQHQPSDDLFLSISNILSVEGKFKAAHTYIDKALALDPFSGMNIHFKGFLYYLEEKYDEAYPLFEKSIELLGSIPFPYIYMGLIKYAKGEYVDGIRFFNALPSHISDLTPLAGATIGYIMMGDEISAQEHLDKLRGMLQTDMDGSALFYVICALCTQGKLDEAIELLEVGIENKQPNLLLAFTEPLMKPISGFPKFKSLRKKALGNPTNQPKESVSKVSIKKEELEAYKTQLEGLMNKKHVYLDSLLSLRSLAELMGVSANQLSQILNYGFEKNFSEYINTYRVEDFKKRVRDPKNSHLTILAVALESGFNSKTVFNTFFKKITGQTPRAYHKQHVTK